MAMECNASGEECVLAEFGCRRCHRTCTLNFGDSAVYLEYTRNPTTGHGEQFLVRQTTPSYTPTLFTGGQSSDT